MPKNANSRATIVLMALFTFGPQAQAQEAAGLETDRVLGTWATVPAVTQAPGSDDVAAYVRQVVIFTTGIEEIRTEAFADAALSQPIFVYSSTGPYELVGRSATVEGAFDAELINDRAAVTIFVDAPEIWRALNLASCPLKIGEAVDIRTCADGPPFLVGNCVDLDLIHVDSTGTRLRFGAQGTDRCVERPAALGDVEFIRQD